MFVFVFLLIYTKRRANRMASVWSYKNQNFSYWGKFQWIFDQGKLNLGRVSRKFHLCQLKLTRKRWLKSGVKSKGKLDLVRVSREFKLSEFELSGFHCSCLWNNRETAQYWLTLILTSQFCFIQWGIWPKWGLAGRAFDFYVETLVSVTSKRIG